MGKRTWTKDDSDQLEQLWPTDMSTEEIARLLGRSEKVLYRRASALKLRKGNSQRKKWTEEESERLIALWGSAQSTQEIASTMHRGLATLYTQASRLGLRRSFRSPRRAQRAVATPAQPVPAPPQPVDSLAYRKRLMRVARDAFIAHGVDQGAAELAADLIARGRVPGVMLRA
jgi:hypothetical protein